MGRRLHLPDVEHIPKRDCPGQQRVEALESRYWLKTEVWWRGARCSRSVYPWMQAKPLRFRCRESARYGKTSSGSDNNLRTRWLPSVGRAYSVGVRINRILVCRSWRGIQLILRTGDNCVDRRISSNVYHGAAHVKNAVYSQNEGDTCTRNINCLQYNN